MIVWSSLGRAASLGSVPVLWAAGWLDIWLLVVSLIAFGCFSVLGFAATQSLLPSLVARHHLVRANARLDQTDAAAQTLGPTAGGALVAALGAPLTLVLDAVSFLVEAALVALLPVDEHRPAPRSRSVLLELREGLTFTYRHRVLGRLAVSTHAWFVAHGAAMTTLALLALRDLRLSALTYGLLKATLGVATLAGASVAPRLGRRYGSGAVVIGARACQPVAWGLSLAATSAAGGTAVLFVAVGLLGCSLGAENANEMGLWQFHTPDALLGRVNAGRRSVNRTLGAAGALLGGALVTTVGTRGSLLAVTVCFVAAALPAATPAVRDARLDDFSGA